MSENGRRIGWMSLMRHAFGLEALEDHDFLRRARPDRDFLALEVLDRLDVGLHARDDRHAAIALRGEDHERLARGGAERRGSDAERAEIDRAGDDRVLAVGRALERNHLDLVAGGRELLVEVRRDAVDQLERADLDDFLLLRRSA